jgi:hypothetical protein
MKEVTRRLGKILALIAVMASAINAQCVLSCSLLALPLSTPDEARIVQPVHSGHACCPGSEQSKPDKEKERAHQPCSDPLLIIGNLSFANTTHAVAVAQYLDPVLTQPRFEFVPIQRSASWPVLARRRGTCDPPVLSTLRI